jgi:O-glycosyl hydrolase
MDLGPAPRRGAIAALLAVTGLTACGGAGDAGAVRVAASAAAQATPAPDVQVIVSAELEPGDASWFTSPPAETDIPYRLQAQDSLHFTKLTAATAAALQAAAAPYTIDALGFASSGKFSVGPDTDPSNLSVVKHATDSPPNVGNLDGGGYAADGVTRLPGDWIEYDDVDFDQVGTYLALQVARGSTPGADMAVWVDGITGAAGIDGTNAIQLATLEITSTGGWGAYQPFAVTNLDKHGLTGKHKLYVLCEGSSNSGVGNLEFISFTAPAPPVEPATPLAIHVDPTRTYQSLLGIGTSFEDTTLYALLKNKTDAQRRAVLKDLLDPVSGIGLNLIRITIGTSDFSDGRDVATTDTPWYSYQDGGPDAAFSLQPDLDLYRTSLGYDGGIPAALKLAQEVAAESGAKLTFFASPWSPPGWMKTSGKMVGGSLKAGYEPQLAQYLRSFVEKYEAQGIPIYAITLQNERNYSPPAYPGMLLTDQQEADLVQATYENFHNVGASHGVALDTRIWILDHNWDQVQSAIQVMDLLAVEDKAGYVDAVAFHHYGGNPAQQGTFADAYPGTDIVFTEGAVWGVGGTDGAGHNMQEIVQMLRNGSRSYVDWVTMVTHDSTEHIRGPYNAPGVLSPTMLMSAADDVAYLHTPEYYLVGQFSRYVKPGAVRIASNAGFPDRVTNVAFRNPDGGLVMVAVNASPVEQPITIAYGGYEATGKVPSKTVATFLWKDASSSGGGGHGGGCGTAEGTAASLLGLLLAALLRRRSATASRTAH